MSESIFKDKSLPLFSQLMKEGTQYKRTTNTVKGSTKHGIVHTPAPDATVHHTVSAARPHPTREKANQHVYFMVSYISAPVEWLTVLDSEFCETWDVSFFGPGGIIQRLPPALQELEYAMVARFYLGFDWLYLTRSDTGKDSAQPTHEYIRTKMISCVAALRKKYDDSLVH